MGYGQDRRLELRGLVCYGAIASARDDDLAGQQRHYNRWPDYRALGGGARQWQQGVGDFDSLSSPSEQSNRGLDCGLLETAIWLLGSALARHVRASH